MPASNVTTENRLKRVWKAIKSVFNDTGWAADSGRVSVGRSGRRYWLPGTDLNWDVLAGDLWMCYAVQACLNWKFKNWHQAPPMVTQRKGDEWEAIPDHPLLRLLNKPNPGYDAATMWMGIILSMEVDGNAYLGIERAGTKGLPIELWYIPHTLIKPVRAKGSSDFISYYEYRTGGTNVVRIDVDDIVHIRYGLDPYNLMLGMSPLASGSRTAYVLQQAENYAARTMKNFGMVGAMATPKEGNTSFDPETFVATWQSKTTGDKQGEILAMDGPVEIQWPEATPQTMLLETLQDRPEANICALLGVPPQVCGLHVGRLSKTWANATQAQEAAWEDGQKPLGALIGLQLGSQLLPEFSTQANRQRLEFDYSQVRCLQPDLDALHKRVRDDWLAGLIDRAEWKQSMNIIPLPEDTGLYYYNVTQMINESNKPDSDGDSSDKEDSKDTSQDKQTDKAKGKD